MLLFPNIDYLQFLILLLCERPTLIYPEKPHQRLERGTYGFPNPLFVNTFYYRGLSLVLRPLRQVGSDRAEDLSSNSPHLAVPKPRIQSDRLPIRKCVSGYKINKR